MDRAQWANNRRITETMPTGGVTTYTYDVVGNLIQKVDPNNRITRYSYDADNREITEKWLPAGGGAATYTMTLAYDANGNVASVQDNFSHYAYAYDAVNRVTSIDNTGTPGSPRVTLTYGYDKNGNRISLGDSLGGTDSYAYDARNQLDLVSQAGTSSSGVAPELVFFHHDQAGNLTSQTRYADLAANSKVATTYAYDAANRLTSLVHTKAGGAAIASYGYTLDAANRLTSEAHAWNGGTSTDTITYGYTNNDQLTAVNHSNSAFANESFHYDTNGNRNASGQTTTTGNRIGSDGTSNSTYDAAGNLIRKVGIATGIATVNQWDYRNRLVEVDTVAAGVTTVVAAFTYDALNRQIIEQDSPALPALGDASFENPSLGSGGSQSVPPGTPWTFTGNSGVAASGNGFTTGNPSIPDGNQVGYLNGTATISQTTSDWAAGTYLITLSAAQCGNYGGKQEDFRLLIDGVSLGTFQPSGTAYQTFLTAFTTAAGTHTVTIQGLDTAGGDNTALLDAITITTAPVARDASFETPALGTGGSQTAPTGTPWTFTGNSGIAASGNGFTTGNPAIPDGTQVGYLNGTATISQVIPNWVAGTYLITLNAAQCGTYGSHQEDFRVLVDGTVVGTFKPSGTAYGRFTASFTTGAGSHTITFQGVNSAGGDNTALVDAVSLSRAITQRETVYDGQTPLLDFDGSGHQTARYLSIPGAIDELLARQTASGEAWYLDDRLGSVREIVDNSGAVLDHVDYSVYGQVTAESAPTQGDRFKYASMEYDAALGLNYDRNRWYDSESGKFLVRDPLEIASGDSNYYRYVENSPTNWVDLSGLARQPAPPFPPPKGLRPLPDDPRPFPIKWEPVPGSDDHDGDHNPTDYTSEDPNGPPGNNNGPRAHWDPQSGDVPHWDINYPGGLPKRTCKRNGEEISPKDRHGPRNENEPKPFPPLVPVRPTTPRPPLTKPPIRAPLRPPVCRPPLVPTIPVPVGPTFPSFLIMIRPPGGWPGEDPGIA